MSSVDLRNKGITVRKGGWNIFIERTTSRTFYGASVSTANHLPSGIYISVFKKWVNGGVQFHVFTNSESNIRANLSIVNVSNSSTSEEIEFVDFIEFTEKEREIYAI